MQIHVFGPQLRVVPDQEIDFNSQQKKLGIKKLDPYGSDYLNITDEEAMLEFKYVYQTKLTKETVNERVRSPLGMWSTPETFIDNDVAFVVERLHEYYK